VVVGVRVVPVPVLRDVRDRRSVNGNWVVIGYLSKYGRLKTHQYVVLGFQVISRYVPRRVPDGMVLAPQHALRTRGCGYDLELDRDVDG
jgi:hypothetical protein